jgi:SAM-dependent methyltransferase
MSRWSELTGGGNEGQRFAARFDALAASGVDIHGEATFCERLVPPPARVLDAGCGTGRVAIRLAERGYDCVGVDMDASMLAVARERAPQIPWLLGDLAALGKRGEGLDLLGDGFDLVVAAGNVIALCGRGTEPRVVERLAAHLRADGHLVVGFGLDHEHLPLDEAPVDLASYDEWCAAAGLRLVSRFATWDGQTYDGGGYAVTVHQGSAAGRDAAGSGR